jgi:RNA polymerase sigma-70 factor (ECF subfamily)
MPAADSAAILQSTVASVNSALQRARTALAALPEHQRPVQVEPENAELLARYVDAFQRYDVKALISLLRADALQTMPTFEMWISGTENIVIWMVQPAPMGCAGALVPVRANGGSPGRSTSPIPSTAGSRPWALQCMRSATARSAG